VLFLRHIFAVLLACSAASCAKPIRGELIIALHLRSGYDSPESLPRPTGKPRLEDHDNVVVRQILMADALWRIGLNGKLRDLAPTDRELYAWRDRHVSVQEGEVLQLSTGEFVGTYHLTFRGIDRSTAERVLSLLAESYNGWANMAHRQHSWIASLEHQLKYQQSTVANFTGTARDRDSLNSKIASLEQELVEARKRERLHPTFPEVKSARLL